MIRLPAPLVTPLYGKVSPDAAWPTDSTFYLESADGLFLCRNHRFYRSAVKARQPHGELAVQHEFMSVKFPIIPQAMLEQAVAFFYWAYRECGAESIVLLAWNDRTQQVELLVPKQVGTSYRTYSGRLLAETVRYDVPCPVPEGLEIFGDIHSHCEMGAYASGMDVNDEATVNGLHVIAGKLDFDPPDWHIEAAVDGARFDVARELVFEGYEQRSEDFPDAWREQHSVEYSGYEEQPTKPASGYSYHSNNYDPWPKSSSYYGTPKTTWGGKPIPSQQNPTPNYGYHNTAEDPATDDTDP